MKKWKCFISPILSTARFQDALGNGNGAVTALRGAVKIYLHFIGTFVISGFRFPRIRGYKITVSSAPAQSGYAKGKERFAGPIFIILFKSGQVGHVLS